MKYTITIVLGLIALIGCQKQDIQPMDPNQVINQNGDTIELVDVRWEIVHKIPTDYRAWYAPYGVPNVYDTLYSTDSLVIEYQVEDTELNGPSAAWISIKLLNDSIPRDTLWITKYLDGVFIDVVAFENGYGKSS